MVTVLYKVIVHRVGHLPRDAKSMSYLHASSHYPVSFPSNLVRSVSPTVRLIPIDFEFRLEPPI